jgi:hypothetical protein
MMTTRELPALVLVRGCPARPSLGYALRWYSLVLLALLAFAARAQVPVIRIDLASSAVVAADQAFVYIDANATTGFDAAYDAGKLPNPNGLNIASLIPGGQQLAINGLPPAAFAGPLTVNLSVGVPQDGTYVLQVGQLANFGFVNVYLLDTELQTRQLLTLGTTYTFLLTGANTGGTYVTSTRFVLVFEPTGVVPLPVALAAFTAQAQAADGLVRWATASELHNDYFVVESSVDGRSFQPLGRVPGHGTSAQPHTYEFIDANLARYAAAQVYYRLRQVDTNGAAEYSPVRAVPVPLATGLLVQAYPNPIGPAAAAAVLVRTSTAGLATLVLTDARGRVVGQQQASLPLGATVVPVPETGHLAPGFYLLLVQQGGQQQLLKLVQQ